MDFCRSVETVVVGTVALTKVPSRAASSFAIVSDLPFAYVIFYGRQQSVTHSLFSSCGVGLPSPFRRS